MGLGIFLAECVKPPVCTGLGRRCNRVVEQVQLKMDFSGRFARAAMLRMHQKIPHRAGDHAEPDHHHAFKPDDEVAAENRHVGLEPRPQAGRVTFEFDTQAVDITFDSVRRPSMSCLRSVRKPSVSPLSSVRKPSMSPLS
jgi:hypothetical protein